MIGLRQYADVNLEASTAYILPGLVGDAVDQTLDIALTDDEIVKLVKSTPSLLDPAHRGLAEAISGSMGDPTEAGARVVDPRGSDLREADRIIAVQGRTVSGVRDLLGLVSACWCGAKGSCALEGACLDEGGVVVLTVVRQDAIVEVEHRLGRSAAPSP